MTSKTYNVLFLSTRNSARGILAEAILNGAGGGRFRAFSAGSHPAGAVHPFALEQIKAIGYPSGDLRSKSWDEFSVPGAPKMDFVIAVRDEAAGEAAPQWPGQPITAEWSFRDPAAVRGSEHDMRLEFWTVCREIKTRLEIFCSLSNEKLDNIALEREIARIARVPA